MTTIAEVNTAAAQALAERCVEQYGYRAARVLPDGSVAATLELLFTRAVCLGVTEETYASRFCFQDRALADQRYAEVVSEDDEPAGHIARR